MTKVMVLGCRVLGILLAAGFILGFVALGQHLGPRAWPYEASLEAEGYAIETPEQIVEIYRSAEGFYVREMALGSLAKRVGTEAIPTLREALREKRVEVRIFAAECLLELGDGKSALNAMQETFDDYADKAARLARGEKVNEKIGPVYVNQQYCLGFALGTAHVLAKLGDYRGYELAVGNAIDSSFMPHRCDAIDVLAEIVRNADPTTPEEKAMHALSALLKAADTESDDLAFASLLSNAVRLEDYSAHTILERASKNRHVSEEYRQRAEDYRHYLGKRARWAEIRRRAAERREEQVPSVGEAGASPGP